MAEQPIVGQGHFFLVDDEMPVLFAQGPLLFGTTIVRQRTPALGVYDLRPAVGRFDIVRHFE